MASLSDGYQPGMGDSFGAGARYHRSSIHHHWLRTPVEVGEGCHRASDRISFQNLRKPLITNQIQSMASLECEGGVMALSFRPVNEQWGAHASCFVTHGTLLRVLEEIAAQSGASSETHAYGDKTSVWIEDGSKFLDFVGNERAFTAERLARMLDLDKDQLNPLRFLVSNMSALAAEWRASVDLHGALTFYVDLS